MNSSARGATETARTMMRMRCSSVLEALNNSTIACFSGGFCEQTLRDDVGEKNQRISGQHQDAAGHRRPKKPDLGKPAQHIQIKPAQAQETRRQPGASRS